MIHPIAAKKYLHVFLTLQAIGWGKWRFGLMSVAHNPGKIWFHLVLLPIAAGLLTSRFPGGFILQAPGARPFLLTTIDIVIAGLVRTNLLSLEQVLRNELLRKLMVPSGSPNATLNVGTDNDPLGKKWVTTNGYRNFEVSWVK